MLSQPSVAEPPADEPEADELPAMSFASFESSTSREPSATVEDAQEPFGHIENRLNLENPENLENLEHRENPENLVHVDRYSPFS